MIEDKEFSIEEVEAMIMTLFQTGAFDQREQAMIKYHFGLNGIGRKKPREIGRLVKLPFKKAELEVKRLETRIFNLLKSR